MSNGVSNPEYIEFIKQNTEDIFKGSPIFRKLANTATDLGAVLQNINEDIPNERQINKFIQKDILKPVRKEVFKPVNKAVNKTAKKVRKFFGGSAVGYNKLRVKELKQIVKRRKNEFDRKVNVSGLTKQDLLGLLDELE